MAGKVVSTDVTKLEAQTNDGLADDLLATKKEVQVKRHEQKHVLVYQEHVEEVGVVYNKRENRSYVVRSFVPDSVIDDLHDGALA